MADPNDPLEQFYAQHPELRPGGAAGSTVGKMFAQENTAPKPSAAPPPAPAQRPEGVEVSPGRIIGNNGLTEYVLNPTTHQWDMSPYAPNATDRAAAGFGTGGQQGTPNLDPSRYVQVSDTRAVSRDGLTVATKGPGGWVNSGFPPNAQDRYAAGRAVVAERQQQQSGTRPSTATTTQQSHTPPPGGPYTTARNDIGGGVFNQAQNNIGANLNGPQFAALPATTTANQINPGVQGAAGVPGTIQGNQAPLLSSMSSYTTPGLGIPSEGRTTMYTGPGLNQLNVNPQGTGRGGPVVLGAAQSANLLTNGISPAVSSNLHIFNGSNTGGTIPANAQFGNVAFSVPSGYQQGPSGFSREEGGGSFAPFAIPFGVTGPSATSPGGAGLAVLNGPQNLNFSNADKSVGTGLTVNSPFAYNNIGATYGRSLSSDAARNAVETALLYNQQNLLGPQGAMAVLTAPERGYYSGQGNPQGTLQLEGNGVKTDYGWIFGGGDVGGMGGASPAMETYASGGRVDVRPLGGPVTQYANGGSVDVAAQEKAMREMQYRDMIEQQRDRLMQVYGTYNPAPQRGPTNLMYPPPLSGIFAGTAPGYADGGHMTTQEPIIGMGMYSHTPQFMVGEPWYPGGPPMSEKLTIQPTGQPSIPHFDAGGAVNIDNGGVYVNKLNPNPTVNPVNSGGTQDNDTGGQTPQNTGNGGVPLSPPGTPQPTPVPTNQPPVPGSQPLPPQNPGLDPFDPNILAPWQKAAQDLAMQARARDVYGYRFKAGGLNGPTAIPWLNGDVPTQEIGPGSYYDPSGQVNRVISDILDTQQNLRDLGPQEDVNPIQARVSYIGNTLDDIQRRRQLQDLLLGANAGADTTASQQALQQQIDGLRASVTGNPGITQDQITETNAKIKALETQLAGLQQNGSGLPGPQSRAYQAEIDALNARIGDQDEASLKTELALLQDRLARNQKRINLSSQVANLSKVGVPKLNGPIVPVVKAA